MNSRISDMRCKEVINIATGDRMGYIYDIVFSVETGKITAVVLPGESRFCGLFGKEEDTVIPWECVKRVSSDVVLVDVNPKLKSF